MNQSLRSAVHGVLLALCWAGAALSVPAPAQTWKPTKNVELIVPFAAGSGVDVAARTMHAIWTTKRLVEASSVIVNKVGAGGNLGLIYATQHPGDPHCLVIGSTTLLTRLVSVDFWTGRTFTLNTSAALSDPGSALATAARIS